MRTQRIAYSGLAAGSEHSVALTVDGGVFSWGSSRCGQLGHGSANKETMPRRVTELMGTVVSQAGLAIKYPPKKHLKNTLKMFFLGFSKFLIFL